MNVMQIQEKMSSLQIAEISGKPHNDLMKAIRKMEESWVNLGLGKFSLSYYINEQNRQMPCYELTKTECLYIATKFNDEARAKLILRWEELERKNTPTPMSQIDLIIHSAKMLKEQELRINSVERDVRELKAQTATNPDFYTVVGYASLHGLHLNIKQCSSIGRKASSMCKSMGVKTGEIPDPRFGTVKTYPTCVLDEIFNEPINA